ncbi:hypothetical protein M0P65_05930 [Candidatus Gracilibacteria bacterium]|jgi:hypothetical protein|nr:hypothetical protein [Candidatus Gracilibacteria bacterium]
MKYIMFIQPGGQELPIIFPSGFEHAKVARMMSNTYPGIKTRSAGFIKFIPNVEQNRVDAICFGKSESLKLRYDEMDSSIIGMLTDIKD